MSQTLDVIEDLKKVFVKHYNEKVNSSIIKILTKSLNDLMLLREKENALTSEIPDDIYLPEYITPLMRKWLIQYKTDMIREVTTLGTFELGSDEFKKRNTTVIVESHKLNESTFKRDVYFKEVNLVTLKVYESSGMPLAGLKTVYEYTLQNDGVFLKNGISILNRIS
jgi:hypothetical protein